MLMENMIRLHLKKKMKAKDMFNTLFNVEELTKDEFTSIIWSNPVEDDFISAMCALIDFVDSDYTLSKETKK